MRYTQADIQDLTLVLPRRWLPLPVDDFLYNEKSDLSDIGNHSDILCSHFDEYKNR